METRVSLKPILLFFTSVFFALTAFCDGLHEAKPFAEKHLVMQVSGTEQHAAVLNIASNLMKHYGPDVIDIQVVTFATGIQLLRGQNNPYRQRIESLAANGVRFYVCQNTIDAMKREKRIVFTPLQGAELVKSGVAHILEEVEKGYTLVAP